MKKLQNNYAFLDSQNLNLGVKELGWSLDFRKFKIYLEEKFGVSTAYLFVGYMPKNKEMYLNLQKAGYVLIFKPVLISREDGKAKGNVDAELVLQAMIDYKNYNQAIIVSGDGDFGCLVRYLNKENKLKLVISPDIMKSSVLIRQAAKEKIIFLNNFRHKLEYKKSTA
ncbi:MAG: NYN domain-containing protein [Patescibacteria group bacterium]|jgi:uncharacterized LabA/DUF88 family protein